MKYVFIGGTPTAGKSYLAALVSKRYNLEHIEIDKWRAEMKKYPDLEPWVNFFLNKNERDYLKTTTPKQHLEDRIKQSEAFWPFIKEGIMKIVRTGKPTVFECVNFYPHLVKELPFSGVFMINHSCEQATQRTKERPRWAVVEDLQELEGRYYYEEGQILKEEVCKHGFQTFHDTDEALLEIEKMLNN